MNTQLSHSDQYKMLREEIMQRQQQIYRTELSSIIATGANLYVAAFT